MHKGLLGGFNQFIQHQFGVGQTCACQIPSVGIDHDDFAFGLLQNRVFLHFGRGGVVIGVDRAVVEHDEVVGLLVHSGL